MAIYKLGDICKIVSGNVSKIKKLSNYRDNSGNIDWLLIKNIKNYEIIPPFVKYSIDPEKYKLTKLNKNSIAFSMYASIGELAINYDYNNLYINQSFVMLEPKVNLLNLKYLFYFLISSKKNILKMGSGTTQKNINLSIVKNILIDIPSLEEQNKIIEIIKPIENLFLKYNQLVNISSYEQAKRDINKIIEIIKPIEKINKKIQKIHQLIIKLLKLMYFLNIKNSKIFISQFIDMYSSKLHSQLKYFATKSISEMKINYDDSYNFENINDLSSQFTRANLTPLKNSFLISKLDSENKVIYVNEKMSDYVFSTGFFNIFPKNKNNTDYLLSFFLSEDFARQKSFLSSGSVMSGLNNDSIKKILISNNPNIQSSNLSNALVNLDLLNYKINKIISLFIKKLVIN
ncbi:restriction endonuclease subunit S [Candidatus Mycoplasma pogonae]